MGDESATVRDALYRTLIVLRAFGVAPLRFTRRHTVVVVRVWNAQIYYCYLISTTLSLMIVLVFIALLLFMEIGRMHRDSTIVGLVIFVINLSISMLTANAAAYRAPKRMEYLVLLLNQINKITMLIPSSSMILKDRKRTRNVSIGMFILLSTLAIDYCISAWNCLSSPSEHDVVIKFLFGAFYVQCATVMILEVQIVLVIRMMQTAAQLFNCELKRLLDVVTRGDYRNGDTLLKLEESLGRVSKYYVTLCKIIREMNDREGIVMLLLVVFLIMQLMDNSYRVVVGLGTIRLDDPSADWISYLKIMIRLYFTLIYVVMVGTLVNACDKIQVEIQKMRSLASELMYRNRRAGETSSAAETMLYEKLSLHQPIFKPLSICALTRSLFVTVMSGVITYLFSVLKFDIREKSLNKV